MRILTESWNDRPERASRPFSSDRDGFVLGEGAWIYVVETERSALKRGARIYAEILGYGSTCDAYHRVRLDDSGIEPARAMQIAMCDAGLRPEDMDYVNLHGTSTPLNDRIETAVLRRVLGARAGTVPVNSIKGALGHTMGAAATLEAIMCLLASRDGVVPGTAGYEEPDPACDLDVRGDARAGRPRVSLSTSLGFGGCNAALVLEGIA